MITLVIIVLYHVGLLGHDALEGREEEGAAALVAAERLGLIRRKDIVVVVVVVAAAAVVVVVVVVVVLTRLGSAHNMMQALCWLFLSTLK